MCSSSYYQNADTISMVSPLGRMSGKDDISTCMLTPKRMTLSQLYYRSCGCLKVLILLWLLSRIPYYARLYHSFLDTPANDNDDMHVRKWQPCHFHRWKIADNSVWFRNGHWVSLPSSLDVRSPIHVTIRSKSDQCRGGDLRCIWSLRQSLSYIY